MAKTSNNEDLNACELNDQSLEYLGLTKQPFTHDILTEKNTFTIQAIEKIADSLEHQVQFSDLLLLVEGDHGSGKTVLYRQFIQTDITNTKILPMHAEATDTLVQIQQKISLHLEDLGDANYLDENLKSLQTFDQRPLVVVDNSHVLSDITLQELFRYQQELKQENNVILKILLFANSGMQDTLQKITDIQNDQVYVQHIPELPTDLCEKFILFRLHNAGYSEESLLENDALKRFFKTYHGTPLSIMNQFAKLIDSAISHEISPDTGGKNKKIIASLLAVAVIASSYPLYKVYLNNTHKVTRTNETFTVDSEVRGENNNDYNHQKLKNKYGASYKSIEIVENDTPTINNTPDGIQQAVAKSPQNTIEIDSLKQQTEADPKPTEIANTSTPDSTNQTIETQNTANKPQLTVSIAVPKNKKQTIEAPLISPEKSPEPAIEKPIKITEETIEKSVKKVIPKKPKPEKPKTVETQSNPTIQQLNTSGLRTADWLKQQPKKRYTFQLLGSRNPETLLKFTQKNQLGNEAAWYKTQLKSRPYYVLVYGSYASRKEATKAIEALPTPLKSLKPWIKSMKSVQKAL